MLPAPGDGVGQAFHELAATTLGEHSVRARCDALASRALELADDPEWGPRLQPPSLAHAGPWVIREHLEREAARELVRRHYAVTDAGLARPGAWMLAPGVEAGLARLATAGRDGARALLAEGLSEAHPRLHVGALLSDAFRRRLLAEIECFHDWARAQRLPATPPNSMNHHGLLLDDLGLRALLDGVLTQLVRPLAAVLYPEFGGATLDEHHGFIVEYGERGDHDLAFHVDDSEVTLNVCLGERFEGGELLFRGLRCEAHLQSGWTPEELVRFTHRPGYALLHAGKHRHEALPVDSGRRVNLILWCRSREFRARADPRQACTPWCGASAQR